MITSRLRLLSFKTPRFVGAFSAVSEKATILSIQRALSSPSLDRIGTNNITYSGGQPTKDHGGYYGSGK